MIKICTYNRVYLKGLKGGVDKQSKLPRQSQVRARLAPFHGAQVVDVCPRPVVPLRESDRLRMRRQQPCLSIVVDAMQAHVGAGR